MKKAELIKLINAKHFRSAWDKGVKEYALEILENAEDIEECNEITLEKELLIGAKDWEQYSWDGFALVWNEDIAKRLCTPSELKRTKNGMRKPNNSEYWLDAQTRALKQAYTLILFTLAETA